MSDFLHGWRRKVGLVFLGMALLLTVGWFRSMTIHDDCWTVIGGEQYGIGSANGDLEIFREAASTYDMQGDWYAHWATPHNGSPQATWTSPTYVEQWHCSVAGILIRCLIAPTDELNRLGQPPTYHIIRFPYWELVLALTLIAAALILPRPRRVTRRLNEEAPSVTSVALLADAVPATQRGASGC